MNRAVLGLAALTVAIGLSASCGGSEIIDASGDGGSQDDTTPCGAAGQGCCNGAACDNGLTCNGGTCLASSSGADSGSSSGTCSDQGCTPSTSRSCNTYGMQTCNASCAWGACSCPSTPVCTPNATQCSGSSVQTCDSCGQWGSPAPCAGATPYCASGSCNANPPSCLPGGAGMTNCGPGGSGSESCCTSLEAPGGTYYRTYDLSGQAGGAESPSPDGGWPDEADPATVSGFRLDKYEVTVGRLRQFVTAWNGASGYLPASGSGKHTHLNGGQGLANSGSPGTYETGWVTSDDNNISPTTTNLTTGTNCVGYATWTSTASTQENLPINCVNWYESAAFCIWDGGFLPSEAEWEYAAAGGSQEKEYPWGSTALGTACPGTGCQYAIYNGYYPNGSGSLSGVTNIAPVGTATLGAGVWRPATAPSVFVARGRRRRRGAVPSFALTLITAKRHLRPRRTSWRPIGNRVGCDRVTACAWRMRWTVAAVRGRGTLVPGTADTFRGRARNVPRLATSFLGRVTTIPGTAASLLRSGIMTSGQAWLSLGSARLTRGRASLSQGKCRLSRGSA